GRGDEVGRAPKAREHAYGVEVHIREGQRRREFADAGLLDRGGDPEVRVVAFRPRELAGVLLHDEGPRVVRLVYAVAEAGHFLLVPELVNDELWGGLRPTDRLHEAERVLDRAAVEGPLERRDRVDDRRGSGHPLASRDGRPG